MTAQSLNSTSATFNSAGVLINTSGAVGVNGGDIAITTTGALTAGDLSSNGGYETYIYPNIGPSAGNVTLTAANGNVRVATIEAKGANDITPDDIAGNGGVVSITAGPTSTITLSGNITTTGGLRAHGGEFDTDGNGGNVTLNSRVVLANDIAIDASGGQGFGPAVVGGNIVFGSSVDGAQNLTLTTNAGGYITMSGLVGDVTPLAAILINSAADVTTNGVRAASFTQTAGTGITTINAGTFNDDAFEGINVTNQVNIANNAIYVDGSIAAGTTVDFNATGNTLTITSLGDITTAGGAVNLTSNARILTAGDVTTSGGLVNYNSATTLTGPIQVNASAGNITFENTLDGGYALRLISFGDEQFNGAVGQETALASIETDALGAVIFNGGQVITSGSQTYNDAAILFVDTILDGTPTGNITLASTVNGAHSLTINDAGQTILGGEIGGGTPLVNLTVDTAGGLVLPKTTLTSNMSLTTDGAVTQVGPLYVGGTTHIDAGANPITLTNGANDFVGVVGSLDGTSVGINGTVVSITDSNNAYLGQIAATAGAVTINAGGSIYNGLAGVTNITSTAASMLGGNGGVVGTLYNPVTVNVPSITANATQQQSGVSIDLSGHVGDNTIWLTQTPPGLVILNGMILNPGQIPGVPQNAYATALAVLDQTYLTGNGNVLNTKPYSTVGTLNGAMYPTDDNDKAFNYGPYIYKLPRNVKVKDGGVKLPAGVQLISMNK